MISLHEGRAEGCRQHDGEGFFLFYVRASSMYSVRRKVVRVLVVEVSKYTQARMGGGGTRFRYIGYGIPYVLNLSASVVRVSRDGAESQIYSKSN